MTSRLPIALAAIVLAATGCGGDEVPTTVTETVTRTVTRTVTVERTPTVTAEPEPTPEPTATPVAPEDRPISRADAIATARQSASEYLRMLNAGIGVEPEEWRVSCFGGEAGGPWTCTVAQGPCRGTLTVRRITLGGQTRGIGKVGCVAD